MFHRNLREKSISCSEKKIKLKKRKQEKVSKENKTKTNKRKLLKI